MLYGLFDAAPGSNPLTQTKHSLDICYQPVELLVDFDQLPIFQMLIMRVFLRDNPSPKTGSSRQRNDSGAFRPVCRRPVARGRPLEPLFFAMLD
jgi:hypothetical protein